MIIANYEVNGHLEIWINLEKPRLSSGDINFVTVHRLSGWSFTLTPAIRTSQTGHTW
ncbi:hypothetical protein DM02DRAFT_672285 [Periconia macrospinosa]|uniref:Uncharacterized protein n=1 Tax=Periconia macrospinosa TaxID=97972 RepID=A0A2V1DQ04_9PLEO|nr:hypothetical protein DM02DRAFT_672285 [Periconia macrospinosa]